MNQDSILKYNITGDRIYYYPKELSETELNIYQGTYRTGYNIYNQGPVGLNIQPGTRRSQDLTFNQEP